MTPTRPVTDDVVKALTGVTVCACIRFACVIRSGYLVLANQHTSSEGQGSRDLSHLASNLTELRLFNKTQIFAPTSNLLKR